MKSAMNLAERMERLECENRRIRTWARLGLAGAGAAGVLALSVLLGVKPSGPDVVEARALRLLDRDGKVRATLSTETGNGVALSLFDRQGKSRGAFRLAGDGTPSLDLIHADGHPRVILQVTPDGLGTLGFSEKDRVRVSLGLSPNGVAGLIVSDREKNRSSAVIIKRNGSPFVVVSNKDSNASAALGLTPGNEGGLALSRADGAPYATFWMTSQNTCDLRFYDDKRKSRVIFGNGPEGKPVLLFRDQDGRTVWSAP